ncbi:hypothetical protein TNCV_3751421 [Trichonephila clavipes]|nr:hypothetical protein TNCV_3751421 [Trichonephila clavipes]
MKEWSTDHSARRGHTKGNQFGSEEEESNSTASTLWNKEGQANRMTKAEEPSNNSARKGVEYRIVGDHRVWRS